MEFTAAKTPTQETYHLKCKIVVKEISYLDEQSKESKNAAAKMVFLVPKEGTQRDLFLSAWLPENSDAAHEVSLMLGFPVSGPCRAAVMRRNKNCDAHHLFVMSTGVEEDLILESQNKKWWTAFQDREIQVTVLPETEDKVLDLVHDPSQTAGLLKRY